MTILSPVQGEILVAIVTITWGIFIETWYVSRWTIFFNILPTIVILATIDVSNDLFWFLMIFLFLSIIIVGVSGYHRIKQIVSAKGYGVIALTIGLADAKVIAWHDVVLDAILLGLGVGLIWFFVFLMKAWIESR